MTYAPFIYDDTYPPELPDLWEQTPLYAPHPRLLGPRMVALPALHPIPRTKLVNFHLPCTNIPTYFLGGKASPGQQRLLRF